MMIVSDPDRLTDMAIFSVFSFYGLAFFAVFILRKKQPDVKTYKVPFYPLTPIIAVIGTIYLVVNTVMDKPADALLSIGIGIIGLPIYWVLTRKKSRASN